MLALDCSAITFDEKFIFYQRRDVTTGKKARVRTTLSRAEKIDAQEFAIQLKCAWPCKFHVHVHSVARRKPEERINKSALSDTERPVNSGVIVGSLI